MGGIWQPLFKTRPTDRWYIVLATSIVVLVCQLATTTGTVLHNRSSLISGVLAEGYLRHGIPPSAIGFGPPTDIAHR